MLKRFSNHQSLITILIGLVVYLWGANLSAQDTLWTRTYGGTDNDYGYSVSQCASGGFIIAGSTFSFSAGYYDVYLIRTDANGDTLWTRTYGGTNYDYGYSVSECASGGFIITAATKSFGAGLHDVYLIRTDGNGDTVWTRTYGGTDYDYAKSVSECAFGGFIIAGYTQSFGAGYYDVYLIRTDASGDTLWTRTYGGTNFDYGSSVSECASGGFIITGWTNSFGAGLQDVYLIRTDASGDTLWTRTYGGTDHDYGGSVSECASGGFIIVGETYSFGAGGSDVYLIRTDASGDTLWTGTYGGTDHDYGGSVSECASGGFIIAGGTNSFGAGLEDVYLIRTDEVGIEEGAKSEDMAFLQSYSNLFTGTAKIRYALPKDMDVNISIYNSLGQKVATIVDGRWNTGYHTARWDAKDMSAGIYFIRFKAGEQREMGKILLVK